MHRRGLSEPRQVYLDIKEEDNPEHPRINPWIYRRYQSHAPHAFVRNPFFWAIDTEGNQLPYIDQITVEVLTPELLALKASSGGYPAIFETEDLNLANYGLSMSGREAGGSEVREDSEFKLSDHSQVEVQFKITQLDDACNVTVRVHRKQENGDWLVVNTTLRTSKSTSGSSDLTLPAGSYKIEVIGKQAKYDVSVDM